MSIKISRREFLGKAAAVGGALALGSVGADALAKDKPKPKKANEVRPLLFGAGMIWAFWLKAPESYDMHEMDALASIGGKLTSATFDWLDREPMKGKWDWSYPDRVVEAAQKRGLKQFGYIGNCPSWALPDNWPPDQGYRHPPREECEKDFRNYCRKVAERYKGQVDMFQVWNEPNGCSWINGCGNADQYAGYTKLLRIAYEGLKEGNPNCVIAAGALDYNQGLKEGYKYIEGMYRSGAKGYFDAISIHPYGGPIHWQAIEDTHRVMTENGDGSKGVWITEWGYAGSKGDDPAKALKEVLTTLQTPKYSYVTLANYLCITDLLRSDEYGLFDRRLRPRAIANAFKEMATAEV